MTESLVFGQPLWLWALVPVTALVVLDGWLWRKQPARRRIAPEAIRAVVLGCCVLALSEPRLLTNKPVAHVVFAVDRSASIPPAQLDAAMEHVERLRGSLPRAASVGLLTFGREPSVAVFPGRPWQPPDLDHGPRDEASALARALELAKGLVPDDDEGAIVLLSDGRATDGDDKLDAVLDAAAARGLPIHTIALHPEREDPAIVDMTLARTTFRPGERVEGKVVLDAAAAASAGRLVVRVGERIVHRGRVELESEARTEIPFSFSLDERTQAGALPIEAVYEPRTGDDDTSNNRLATTAVVGAPPQVRIYTIHAEDAAALEQTLTAEQMAVEVVLLGELDEASADLRDTDLVILANTPASLADPKGLSASFIDELVRYVNAGGGLIVTGGPRAFDLGGLGYTPLAQVLPVRIDNADPELEAAAAMVIILDRSGSMSAMADGPGGPRNAKTKMELADEGAVASVRLLRPFDFVGVMSVTEWVRWEVPLQPVHDLASIERKIMGIRADGGGIFVYTALDEAHKALQRAETPLRHIILFSDAADAEEKIKGIPFGTGPGPRSEDLAASMHKNGITTSVIGIGNESDLDTPFLEQLAQAGGGRFYLTDDARKLRSLFVQETERLVDSSVREGAFRVQRKRNHPAIAGIEYARAPDLLGFQQLEPRTTADVLLADPQGHPLLALWRYGLGQVIVWTSDASPRWAERWLDWRGFVRQWTQLARFALREDAGKETALEVEHGDDHTILRVARRTREGLALDEHGLRLRVHQGDDTREVSLHSAEPGLWHAELPSTPGTVYRAEVVDDRGEVLADQAFAAPLSAERRHRTADLDRLRRISQRTGGEHEPATIEPTLAPGSTPHMRRLWPWLAGLAIVLLPFDAWLRRSRRDA